MQQRGLQRAVDFLDSWLAYRARSTDIPGFAVAILRDKKLLFSRAYGLADIEHRTPLTSKHLFSMASQTKMVTATLVLRLVEQEWMGLEEPIGTYLPWLAEHEDKRIQAITIRQLLSHGAGLARDGSVADYWQLERPFPTEQALRRIVLDTPLALEPGAALKYSNTGYALLGLAVEAVTGSPYSAAAQQVVDLAGMHTASPDYTPSMAGRLATGYTPPFEGRRMALKRTASAGALTPSVGLCATPEGMCRLVACHFRGNATLLGSAMQDEAQRRQRGITEGYDSGVAFGLGFEHMAAGNRELLGHNGHLAGHTTATYFDPRDRLAVSVATNSKNAPAVQMVRGIFGALDYFTAAAAPTPPHLARLQARLYSHLAVVEVVASGERVVVIDPDDWEPFGWAEEAAYVSPGLLKITTSGSAFNEGEFIRYTFGPDDRLRSVHLAGIPLLPERAYRRLLARQQA